jgi:hypothetical protein
MLLEDLQGKPKILTGIWKMMHQTALFGELTLEEARDLLQEGYNEGTYFTWLRGFCDF